MILEEFQSFYFDRINRKKTFKMLRISCDDCNRVYEKRAKAREFTRSNFCSKTCFKQSLKNGVLRAKTEKTNYERCGAKSNLLTTQHRELTRKRCVELYGVEHPWKNKDVRKKCSETMVQLYGGKNVFASPALTKRVRETMLEKYGKAHPMQVETFRKKMFETMSDRHRSRWISKDEDRFFEFIKENFVFDIKRQKYINGRFVDFYLPEIDTFVEFDGVYWHGLDKEFNELSQDRAKTFLRDREQDKFFEENNIRLVRVTDQEFKHADHGLIIERLIGNK